METTMSHNPTVMHYWNKVKDWTSRILKNLN